MNSDLALYNIINYQLIVIAMSESNLLKSKSKILAFLIAIILGPLGFHNFYLGRWKRGFAQFFLVLITLGAGLLITYPWAYIEGLLILIGKYSMGPKPKQAYTDESGIAYLEETKVSAMKEYLIAAFLLSPLIIFSIFTMGVPIIFAIIFYFLVGGLWNVITRLFIKIILPIYASVFSAGKKFLIRFSEYKIHPTSTRPELFRATRKLSITAVFVLFFLISLIAQSNTGMVTEGNIPDAVICDDGTIELTGLCDDESVGSTCDAECVMDNTDALDRVVEAYSSVGIIAVLMFSPFITVLIAPILVLRYSSLSIVDKKTRSMSPIGEKANDLTNVGAGFGALVIFFQTAWRISSAAVQDGDITTGVGYVAMILILTLVFVLMFYPLIWLPMLKFTKAFESHVLKLDNSLVDSKGIEVHQLIYEDNQLRIMPVQNNVPAVIQNQTPMTQPISTQMPPQDPENSSSQLPPPRLESEVLQPPPPMPASGPSLDTPAQSTDENGYEWLLHEGKNYYRFTGSNSPWQEL